MLGNLDNEVIFKSALDKLELWKKSITQNGITAFDPFLKMVESKQEYVLNYVLYHLSHAVTEGCDNVIRAIGRAAFGMTNFQNLRWRVLAAQSILH